jgi:hypothetical protein
MKGHDTPENREHNRKMRAIEAGLPDSATWAEISAVYISIKSPKAIYDQDPDETIWVHPYSGKVVQGVRITKDLTPLKPTDVFVSRDGGWKKCDVKDLLFRPFTNTIWIRPK